MRNVIYESSRYDEQENVIEGAMDSSRWPSLASGILLCFLLFAQQGGGQAKSSPSSPGYSPQETAPPAIPMLDEGKGIIHLDVAVMNGDGEPVSGLSRGDFELLDEGRPQKIRSFHAFSGQLAGPEPPAQAILFFDTLCGPYSSCMSKGDELRAQAAIGAFLRQNKGHLHQPVSIFGISDDGLWTVPHHDSAEGNSLASDLLSGNRILLNRRPDALRALAFIAAAQRRKRGHKVMLWIGPGCGEGTGIFPANSNAGHKTFNQIYWFTTLLREARISIDELPVDQEAPCEPGYQLYLNGPRMVHDASDRFLYKKVLAIQSGGSVVNDTNDLVTRMNRCVGRALSFYSVSFDPPVAVQPNEYHAVQVQADKPGLVVHTNTGYYDEPFYSDQPNPAVQRVTVEQLDQILSETNRRGRDERAEKLSKLELAERVSLADLAALSAGLRNKNLQQSLAALADVSAFLEPPPAEIPKLGAPDEAALQQMLVLVKDYLEKIIPKLPDFYATRTTVRYEEKPELDHDKSNAVSQPLQVVELSKARVLYRDRDEVVEERDQEHGDSGDRRLTTHGTFGPILAEVRNATALPGRMKWVRWENDPEGKRAVFAFEVPAAESRYFEGGCCLPDAEGGNSFRIQAGYREEVAINPEKGTILRLQQQFDMDEYVPLDRDEVVIDYGPVKIGGKTYVCPVRSVSLARGRSVTMLRLTDQSFLTWGPYSTKMNEMRFSNYHVFRSESRILPGFKPEE